MLLIFSHLQTEKNLPSGPRVQVPIPLDAEILFCSPCAFRERLKKKKKKTWIRERKFSFTERGWFFPLCSYSGSTWNLSTTSITGSFLAIYHWVHFSKRVTSDHSLVWNIQNKEHFRPEASDKFNIPVCSARCVPSWVRCSLALLSTPCRTWEEIGIIRKF